MTRAVRRGHEINFVISDQLLGELARALAVGLIVVSDELHLVSLTADLDAAGSLDALKPQIEAKLLFFAGIRKRSRERQRRADPDDILGEALRSKRCCCN